MFKSLQKAIEISRKYLKTQITFSFPCHSGRAKGARKLVQLLRGAFVARSVGEESCRQVLEKSVGEESCRQVLEKSVEGECRKEECCREVLEKSVVKKCRREVLEKSVVEKCCRRES